MATKKVVRRRIPPPPWTREDAVKEAHQVALVLEEPVYVELASGRYEATLHRPSCTCDRVTHSGAVVRLEHE